MMYFPVWFRFGGRAFAHGGGRFVSLRLQFGMEFMNRTEHLGMQRNYDFAAANLGAKL